MKPPDMKESKDILPLILISFLAIVFFFININYIYTKLLFNDLSDGLI